MAQDDDHDDALHEAEQHLFWGRYSPIPISDVTSGRIVPPPWLFGPDGPHGDGLLRSRTITMLSAEPFTGKTMLLLAMALSLATDSPLLGYSPLGGQNVLFLGQDAPTWDYYGSIRKLWIGLGAPSIPANRAIFFLNRGLRLEGPDISTLLEDAVRVQGTTILMIDTLLAFHGRDENSNKEMASVMDLLKSWRDRLGLTILFSHHTAKPSAASTPISGNYRARGASVISGSVDFHLQLASRAGGVSLGIPKRRGSSKRRASDSFVLTDLPNDGLSLREREEADDSAVTIALGLLAQPRQESELKALLSDRLSGSTATKEGRFHGVLGYLRRKDLVTILADGRIVAVPR